MHKQVLDDVVDAHEGCRRPVALARKLLRSVIGTALGSLLDGVKRARSDAGREEAWELLYTTLGRMAGEEGAARSLVGDLCADKRLDLCNRLKGLEGAVDKFGLEYLTTLVQARTSTRRKGVRRKRGGTSTQPVKRWRWSRNGLRPEGHAAKFQPPCVFFRGFHVP